MDKPKRILIIQLKRAGDVIVAAPVLSAIRTALPHVQIDFLVDRAFAPLLQNHPFVDHVHTFRPQGLWAVAQALRHQDYDWVIDFQSSPRSILLGLLLGVHVRAGYRVTFWGHFLTHTIPRPGSGLSVTEGKLALVKSLLPEAGPAGERKIYLTDDERQWATQQLGDGGAQKTIVGLIPTHRRSSRRWPARYYARLAQMLSAQKKPVWIFWGPGEEDYVAAIQQEAPETKLIPKTSLREMASLLERCKVVITNDNGPMHLAEAVGSPTVTMYGPTDPKSWNVGGPRHRILQAQGLPCLGCNMNECPFGHECMTHISPEQVLELAGE